MKVLDLACPSGHVFEGWFAGEADFQHQLSTGWLTCPMCGSGQIAKRLSAPRLNLSTPSSRGLHAQLPDGRAGVPTERFPATDGADKATSIPSPVSAREAAQMAGWNALVSAALGVMAAQAQDVGDRFAREARRMHRGESEARSIRGRTTEREAHELREEGIPVVQLNSSDDGPGGTLQ